MCGIAGFSLVEGSRVNARHLSHHLLKQIENRGSHASGFAFANRDGQFGVYKSDKPGSQLPMYEMPRRSDTVILHTRYATQGSPSDNRNNHPVISTDRRIAVVHNGVISNDHRLREGLGINETHGLVDSLVIPSLLAQEGTEGLTKLSGYASIAWVDVSVHGVLNIARLKSSPVAYTWLTDGSLVFASTPALLEMALIGAGYNYGGIFDMAEGKMMQISNGFVYSNENAPKMSYDYQAYGRYSGATAGGHSSGTTSRATGKSSTTPPPTVTFDDGASKTDHAACTVPATSAAHMSDDEPLTNEDIEAYYEDLEQWRRNQAKRDTNTQAAALKALEKATGAMALAGDDGDDDVWSDMTDQQVAQMDGVYQSIVDRYKHGEGFYIIDDSGSIEHYPELDSLEGKLAWLSKMGKSDNDLWPGVDEEINWVNHILDIGSVDEDGSLISWIDDSGDIDNFESPAVKHLSYIRDGVHKIATLKGA